MNYMGRLLSRRGVSAGGLTSPEFSSYRRVQLRETSDRHSCASECDGNKVGGHHPGVPALRRSVVHTPGSRNGCGGRRFVPHGSHHFDPDLHIWWTSDPL